MFNEWYISSPNRILVLFNVIYKLNGPDWVEKINQQAH